MPDDDRDEVTGSALRRAGRGTSTRSWSIAVGLVLLAGVAVWAAFIGVGPAAVDTGTLRNAVEVRTAGLTEAAILITTVGSTFVMAVLACLVGALLWRWGRPVDAAFVVLTMATAEPGVPRVEDLAGPAAAAGGDPAGAGDERVAAVGARDDVARRHRLARGALLGGTGGAHARADGAGRRGLGRPGRRHPHLPGRALVLRRRGRLGGRRRVADGLRPAVGVVERPRPSWRGRCAV